jgi:hypothetical protein
MFCSPGSGPWATTGRILVKTAYIDSFDNIIPILRCGNIYAILDHSK